MWVTHTHSERALSHVRWSLYIYTQSRENKLDVTANVAQHVLYADNENIRCARSDATYVFNDTPLS